MAKKKITPGFVYPSEAEALTQAMATIGQQGQRMATGRESNEERVCIPVSITARDSGTGYYSWTEQTYDASGVRITRPGGLTGTHTFNPLRLLGDTVLTTFPVEGLIVRAIGTATKGVVYEAAAVEGDSDTGGGGGGYLAHATWYLDPYFQWSTYATWEKVDTWVGESTTTVDFPSTGIWDLHVRIVAAPIYNSLGSIPAGDFGRIGIRIRSVSGVSEILSPSFGTTPTEEILTITDMRSLYQVPSGNATVGLLLKVEDSGEALTMEGYLEALGSNFEGYIEGHDITPNSSTYIKAVKIAELP